MLSLRGNAWILQMKEDGTGVVMEDRLHKTRWCLDETTRLVRHDPTRQPHLQSENDEVTGCRLGQGKAQGVEPNTILVKYETPAGHLILRWVMEPDRLRVIAEGNGENPVTGLSLPGSFYPEDKKGFLTAVPNGQGILHTGKGPDFFRSYFGSESFGYTLAMFGQIAGGGALLTVTETDTDAVLRWEKKDGKVRIMWQEIPSFGKLSYPREVIFFPTDPNLTALCKQYRKYEIEKGRFRTWEEKIASRPKLARMFGAALVFLGYLQDPDLDYAESFRKLKAAGIDKAFVYPVYHVTPRAKDITALRPDQREIDIRHLHPLLHELGYLAGSFIWLTEGEKGAEDDPYLDARLDQNGKPVVFWEMLGIQWLTSSMEKRLKVARYYLENEHKGLDGIHFDCLTGGHFVEDYHPRHQTDARADASNRRTMLEYTGGKGLVISSEGFWGRATPDYDLGNTKYGHILGGEEYCVVPMTMLVYHDSAYHTWWEVDNYNNPEHLSQYGRAYYPVFRWGGGAPKLQSAIDALMGTPPDIFPFGRMWNFIPHTKDLYYYRHRIEDPGVQAVLSFVKPVMALNAKIGKLEMVEHHIHTPEGAVQETVFADGTRVIANFANVPMEAPGPGPLPPESWITLT